MGLLAEGNAWIGTEDIATSTASETQTTINYMQGTIAVRPTTPNTWQSNRLRDNITNIPGVDMVYYAYYAYDAVLTVAHALNYRIDEGDDVLMRIDLEPKDYFANITQRSANGSSLGEAITTLQLPPTWMMAGPLYMSDNTRKMTYELVNFADGEMKLVGQFSWNKKLVNAYFEELLDQLSIVTRNATGVDPCISLDWTARASNKTQWNQVEKLFYVQNRALTTYYPEKYQANSDVTRLWNECLRPILGLDRVYSLSAAADDYGMFEWSGLSLDDNTVVFSGNTTTVPLGALWKVSEPLTVLAWLIEPWGELILPNDTDTENYEGIVEVSGFLPTIWENITGQMGITTEYYWKPNLGANDAINLVANGTYDAALGAFTITDERAALVHFIQQFHGGGLKILSKKPDEVSTSWMFLRPFGFSLWLACFLTIVFVAVMIWGLEWDTDTFLDDDGNRLQFHAVFIEAVTISSSVLFYTHEPPKGIHTRVFVLVFQYVILIWIAAYTANMASFLTLSSDPEPEVVAFIDLYKETSRVATVRNGYSEQVLNTKSVEIYKLCDTTQECLDFVYESPGDDINNVFVYDDDNIDFWAQTSDNCKLVAPGDPFNSVSFAFPTTYNVIPESILSALNVEMIDLWSTGLIQVWIDEFIDPLKTCDEYVLEEGSDTESITITNMAELFMFIGGFSICFCGILIVHEKVKKHMKAKEEIEKAEREAREKREERKKNKNENQRHLDDLINEEAMQDGEAGDGDRTTGTTTTTSD